MKERDLHAPHQEAVDERKREPGKKEAVTLDVMELVALEQYYLGEETRITRELRSLEERLTRRLDSLEALEARLLEGLNALEASLRQEVDTQESRDQRDGEVVKPK